MAIYASQGDPRETMLLLWRKPADPEARSGPGPKPGLTIDTVVEAAIEIADEKGMEALSMRAVGERLDRTAMALYTYIPNKSVLIDLMFDQVQAEMPTGYDLGRGWRAAIGEWAGDLCDFYTRHPWVLQVSEARPVLGPNENAVYETVVRILNETGLEPRPILHISGTLFHFIRGAAQTIAETRSALEVTGVSDEEWWHVRSAVMHEVAPDFAERFPLITAFGEQGVFEPIESSLSYFEAEAQDTFDNGLALILDGIEVTRTR
ncbi:MAG TPA: TetR/AcrR family transcriptional regulator [Solirubrobacterales bacterium]|nr:TetR/AcrR family transcriptional regulator [Solirubrobacterales bacterium]